MAALTLAQCETYRDQALTAYTKVMAGQAWTYNGKSVTRADLGAIMKAVKEWEALVVSKGGSGTHGVQWKRAVIM